MFQKHRRKKLHLQTVYYLSFLFFIVIPILVVLIGVLLMLNQQFKSQAMENIMRAQEAVITELKADIDTMSMRLSHLIYTNNNEILNYAAKTDTKDSRQRYENEQRLQQAGNLALEPVKDIISTGFYMKDGGHTYIKAEIIRPEQEIRESKWYLKALEKKNTVCIGSYDTVSYSDLYLGGKSDLLILVFALAPDVTTDRSEKIEMVAFYQSSGAGEKIKEYNGGYLSRENKLGIMRLTDKEGSLLFSTKEEKGLDFMSGAYTSVKTPVDLADTTWYLESYISTRELTADYWNNARLVLGTAVLVLILAGYFSRYFLRSIVKPVEAISIGLKQVEEGNLEVHITPKGQSEVRNMIHQFNAMARRLKALIGEYEERAKSVKKSPRDYLAAMVTGEMTPEEVNSRAGELFIEQYALLGIVAESGSVKKEGKSAAGLTACFERNPRYASRCITYRETPEFFLVMYRITEEAYEENVIKMAEELQKAAGKEFGARLSVCIGCKTFGCESFLRQAAEIKERLCFRYLQGDNAIINLNEHREKQEELLQLAAEQEGLALDLYVADEKNMTEKKERLFAAFSNQEIGESRFQVFAVILALGKRFSAVHSSFLDLFGQQYNYIEKIKRIEDVRSLKLWVTNYFAWIMDYSASRLNVSETDVIIKAKHYMADHYEEADLSLNAVAEYVGLNEKYFTNRFTKEAGETFSSYLTGLRMQKARELLKTTSFKVYEIAEMAGYNNVEHFNRVFKKLNDVSPAQYRKNT